MTRTAPAARALECTRVQVTLGAGSSRVDGEGRKRGGGSRTASRHASLFEPKGRRRRAAAGNGGRRREEEEERSGTG